jgi:NAD(P)H-dependent flavin oxidoreductase YrpB (nitropropane dioxygenase family)
MKTPLCDLLGIEFPLFAFSHCRDVVAAVTNAGGFGVLGASRHTPDELELELKWIDEHVHGRPYGVDILIPENMIGRDENVDSATLRARVPERHKEFVRSVLGRYGVTVDLDDPIVAKREFPLLPAVSARLMDVAFSHPIKLIANALGLPPQSMIDRGRAQGVAVAALVGAKEHAVRQVQAGVDIIVAEGAEAGGHCGEVSTLVLVPEVIRALEPIRPVPVLAAGGIVTGRQMAAMMALGAAGAWYATRALRGILYGVESPGSLPFVAVALVLLAAAALACLVPALRAAAVDPMQALRQE